MSVHANENNGAITLTIHGQHRNVKLEDAEQLLEELEEVSRNPKSLQGIKTGFNRLDRLTNGFQKSDLILIAARPSVGKTSFAMNLVNNAALNENAKVAVFSLEMPEKQIIQRSLSSIAKIDMERIKRGQLKEEEWMKLLQAKNKFDSANIYIDDSSLNTPMQILSKCRRLKKEKGLDLIMIDYLQLMSCHIKMKHL